MVRRTDDGDFTPDNMIRSTTLYPSARVDIPVFNRHTLREAAQILHELANALGRYSLNPPGETLSDATALGMARTHVRAANAILLQLKKRDVAEHKRANVIKFGTERKIG